MYEPINISSIPADATRNIRAEMMRAGITNVMVAEKAGKHPSLVSKNLRGLVRTPEIRDVICEATGMTESELWPQSEDIIEKKRQAG